MATAPFDIVVVGAGLSGIVAAARALQAHPDCNLAMLEQDYCLGGVWSQRRIYPSFWSQTAHGLAEFADMVMARPPEEDCKNDLFRAKYTTKYLEDYVDKIRITDRSLRDRIQFNTRVQSITKVDGRWHLSCIVSKDKSDKGNTKLIVSAKLMIADGQSAVPRMPYIHGQEDFKGTMLHSIDFGQSNVIINDKVKHVTVLGGGKSAADMVYESAKAGKTVSWIIRKTGDDSTGPGFLVPADVPTPYRNPGSGAQTRVMSSLQPCFMIKDSWWARFLHGTKIGTKIVTWIFKQADAQVQKRALFKERKIERLQYETSLFWQNGTGGVLHHDDFYDLVSEKVNIYRGRVSKLQENKLFLGENAETCLPCDCVLFGTGWERGLDVFDNDLRMQLGIPYPKSLEPHETTSKWKSLVQDADKSMLDKYIILGSPPPHSQLPESRTPYRLYRGMAPLKDDSILFMNHVTVSNKLFGAEVQAMWAVAYFDGKISLPSVEDRERDISTWIAWISRRYLSNGQLGNYVAFDGVSYADVLLEDMGVTAHQQKGFFANFFAPFLPADLGLAWQEYLSQHGA
ncbi:flavin-binding monooxygenase-like protein-like protein [Pleomassaria siparia CBS 279.74]|uniref:Flavin-binding monooxygenase-like protein-like protein n=1 Tax=Pleomassaria siparia CBS 279.74 TaxID=1314801 RepID=A0A6G1K751_9PLEO|nr:flavin-binding monooxygenase-like protein-like protein [Pleomassaria siparia CBS 279.74]